MLLERLVGKPFDHRAINLVKDTLSTFVRREDDDGNTRVSFCRMIGTAFIVFGGEDVWPEFVPFIRRCALGHLQKAAMLILRHILEKLGNLLEESTNVEIRTKSAILLGEVIEQPLAEYNQNMVKDVLLTCVENENERIVRKSLCHTIVTAFRVFGGENGWPELFPFIVQCVSGGNDLLHQAALLILGNLLLEQSTNVEIRSRSANLLQELVGKIAMPLDVHTESQVKDILLRCVKKEDDRIVSKSLCHTIATAFNVFSSGNMFSEDFVTKVWPELFSFVRHSVSPRCASGHLQEAALLIYGSLKLLIRVRLISLKVFLRFLNNRDSVDLRIAAFGAAISYIRHGSDEMDGDLVPVMTKVLTEGLNGGQEVTTQEALKLLIERAHEIHQTGGDTDEPQKYLSMMFSVRQLVGFVRSAFEIAESPRLEEKTRHLAIDFVTAVKEGWQRDTMSKEFPEAIKKLLKILMSMLSDIVREAASHLAENEDDDTHESINNSVVLKLLDRLVDKPYHDSDNRHNTVFWHELEQYFVADEWQTRAAAIVAFEKIEKSEKVTDNFFYQSGTMVVDLFEDLHPRVRLAAIKATDGFSTNLDHRDLQREYHGRVLAALAKAISDFQYPRVQTRVVPAMVNISKKYPTNFVKPYLHESVRTLLQNAHNSDQTKRLTISNLLKKLRDSLLVLNAHDAWLAAWVDLPRDQQLVLESLLRS